MYKITGSPFKPAKTCDCCMHIKYKLRAIGEKYGMMYSIFWIIYFISTLIGLGLGVGVRVMID